MRVELSAFAAWAKTVAQWDVPKELQTLISNDIAGFDPYRLFQADSDDYPPLLHIAVRVWDEARQQTTSDTPKQRIRKILDRRLGLSDNEKEMIASIANWDKQGGRPKNPPNSRTLSRPRK
jgi:hypothetical protein